MADSLSRLMRVDPERLRRLLIEEELAPHPWLSGCGRQVIQELAAELAGRLPEALDTRLETLVLEAFRRQPPEFQTPAGQGSGEGSGEIDVPLPSQRLQSRHRPALVVLVGQRPLLEVVFDLSLELRLEGVVLRLREGVPRSVAIRRAQGSGLLMLGRQMLSRFGEAPVTLPPVLSLEGGPVRGDPI
jgi:hypothetical protein